MASKIDMNAMDVEVRRIKAAAERLGRMGADFPAIERNTQRILASVKMLELNVSDYVALGAIDQ